MLDELWSKTLCFSKEQLKLKFLIENLSRISSELFWMKVDLPANRTRPKTRGILSDSFKTYNFSLQAIQSIGKKVTVCQTSQAQAVRGAVLVAAFCCYSVLAAVSLPLGTEMVEEGRNKTITQLLCRFENAGDNLAKNLMLKLKS